MRVQKIVFIASFLFVSVLLFAKKESKILIAQQALDTVFLPKKITKIEGPVTLYTPEGLTEGAYMGLIVDKALKKARLSLVRKSGIADLMSSKKGVFVHALRVRKELSKDAKTFQGIVASLMLLLSGIDIKDSMLSEKNFNWQVKFKNKKHEIKLTPKIKLLNILFIKIVSSENHKFETMELYTKDSTFGFVFESQAQSVVKNSKELWSASKKLSLSHNKNFFYVDDSFKPEK